MDGRHLAAWLRESGAALPRERAARGGVVPAHAYTVGRNRDTAEVGERRSAI